MAEEVVQTEAEKEAAEDRKREESYKTPVDVERVSALANAVKILHDYPNLNNITSSLGRELKAIELKQEDADAKEAEENAKREAERAAKKQKAAKDAANAKEAAVEEAPPKKRSA